MITYLLSFFLWYNNIGDNMNDYFLNTAGISIICSIFLVLIFILFIIKKNKLEFSGKLYFFLVILTILSNIFYIIWAYFVDINLTGLDMISRITCYFISLWDIFFIIYVYFVFKSKEWLDNFKNKYKVHFNIFLFIIFILNALICLFLNVNSELSSISYNITGALYTYLDIMGMTSILIGLIILLFYRKKLDKLTVIIGIYIFIICSASVVIQLFTKNYANDMCFRMTSLILFLFFSVESQDAALLEEYRISTKKAQDLEKLKREFINNISYQFKSPLNSIVGYSNLLSSNKELDFETLKNDSANVLDSSVKLHELINSIIDISKIESKNEILNISNYKLDNIIYELNDNINSLMKNNMYFSINVNEDCFNELVGDEFKLNKILHIFLKNIIEYTNEGEINLNISSNMIDSSNCELIFSIKSNAFYNYDFNTTLDDLIKSSYDNRTDVDFNSLNIIIANSLLQIIGGSIEVTCENNKSTLSIKLNQKLFSQNKVGNIKSKLSSDNNVNLFGKRFLVVDDKNVSSVILKRLLIKNNALVDVLIDPKDIINMIKNNVYDAIFIEYDMDSMNGEEIIKYLDSSGNKVPVSVAIISKKTKYKENSFDYILLSPIKKKQLNHLLNKIIGGGSNGI